MMKLSLILGLLAACLACTLAEPKNPQRGVIHHVRSGLAGPNPYIFFTLPQGRSQTLVKGFEVMEDDEDEAEENHNDINNNDDDDDDDDDDHQDDDDDADEDDEEQEDNMPKNDNDQDDDNDDEEEIHDVMNMKMKNPNLRIKNAKPTHMMVSREHAGSLMVPDEIIEIEGQSVIDEKTGKPALLLPRAILDTIPDGSVVALMERSSDDNGEERANRVLVRRSRKGSRRKVKRRRRGNKKGRGGNRRRRGGNKRRRNKRKNVRVIRPNNKRRNNRRRVVNQG